MLLRRIAKHFTTQNWAAIAIDFLIVVSGVGIALKAEQWINEGQQRTDYVVAERSVRADFFSNYLFAQERLALTECRKDNLRAIAERLKLEDWAPLPTGQMNSVRRFVFPAVFSTPTRPWGSRLWDAELSRGTLSGLSVEERLELGLFFYGAQTIADLQAQMLSQGARLKTLALVDQLPKSDVPRYLDAVMQIDNDGAVIEMIAGQMVTIAHGVMQEYEFSDAERVQMRQSVDQLSNAGQKAYGDCFEPIQPRFLRQTPPS